MAINIRIGKLLKRNMFKSLKGDVYTHTNETEFVVRIFGAEWGTGFEHSRKGQTFLEDRSLPRKRVIINCKGN